MALAYIGLGSNLGDRRYYIEQAEVILAGTGKLEVAGRSGIEETDPVEYTAQPRFLNRVISARTELEPFGLLDVLLETEDRLGRVRDIPKGPRTVDCDLLLYDDVVLKSERLVLPHPGVVKRDFVLKQVLEINPHMKDPVSGRGLSDILNELRGR